MRVAAVVCAAVALLVALLLMANEQDTTLEPRFLEVREPPVSPREPERGRRPGRARRPKPPKDTRPTETERRAQEEAPLYLEPKADR